MEIRGRVHYYTSGGVEFGFILFFDSWYRTVCFCASNYEADRATMENTYSDPALIFFPFLVPPFFSLVSVRFSFFFISLPEISLCRSTKWRKTEMASPSPESHLVFWAPTHNARKMNAYLIIHDTAFVCFYFLGRILKWKECQFPFKRTDIVWRFCKNTSYTCQRLASICTSNRSILLLF